MRPTRTPTTRTPTLTTPTRTPTPRTRASGALARSVEPVSTDDFLAEHWEQRPLVVERDEPGRFDDLLSLADAERLVTEGLLREPGFRLVKADGAPRGYTIDIPWRPDGFRGAADVARVAEEFAAGATIVLQALHHSWPPLQRFCRELEAELGHPAQANAYYTPRRSQGLPVHHDTHEVLTLQVAGEKRWLVYEPVLELPLRDQRYRPELGEPGPVVLDVVQRPGDTLYLPRGWLHQALTSDSDSLHLTIGINVATWLDAVRAALEECADDVEFRRSVPADGEGGSGLAALLAERLAPDAVARRTRERFVRGRRPILDGQLAQLRALDELTAETPLERRETVVFDLDGAVLSFERKRIAFPERLEAELEFVAAADGPFRAVDLPGSLDDAGRLVLARRLVREGFLRILDA